MLVGVSLRPVTNLSIKDNHAGLLSSKAITGAPLLMSSLGVQRPSDLVEEHAPAISYRTDIVLAGKAANILDAYGGIIHEIIIVSDPQF